MLLVVVGGGVGCFGGGVVAGDAAGVVGRIDPAIGGMLHLILGYMDGVGVEGIVVVCVGLVRLDHDPVE